jgi:hypothetical protein
MHPPEVSRGLGMVEYVNPKRHHYVPQFYLRYFSLSPPDSPRAFWVYDKAGGPPRQQTPVNTAVETHFYSVDASGVGRDDRAERAFAMLESAAKPILDRWQNPGVRPTGLEIQEIAGFLAFMHTRVPRAHQVAKEMEEALTTEWLKDLSKDPDRVRGMLSRYEAENGPPSITPEELTESLSKVGEDFSVEDVSKYPWLSA